MSRPILHQVVVGASIGDAITEHALAIRRWLREFGFASHIYAEHVHTALAGEIRPFASYRPGRHEQWLIFHHSIGSAIVDQIVSLPQQLIVIYHNITPAEFFNEVEPAWAQRMSLGREQLALLRPRTHLALADSFYNQSELQTAGYVHTDVLPIVLDESQYHLADNEQLCRRFNSPAPKLLFVGKLAPHKKQEDLVKLLYYYRRIEPEASLFLVGDQWLASYDDWLRDLSNSLGLQESVIITGRVSQQDMLTFYRLADLYVSMSEHEGFGKPLIESMYLGLPVLAYASTAVPLTLGKASVLFHQKDFEALAEVVDIIIKDRSLRQRIVARQKQQVHTYLEPQVRQKLHELLSAMALL
jgi:L-malate glycosyltransferase